MLAPILMLASTLTFQSTPWQYATSAEAGYDGDKLMELGNYAEHNSGSTFMVVAVDGRIMFTYGDIRATSIIASCRKSVLSMLYGKYVADGTSNLDSTVGELGIDDIGGLLESEKLATVYDLLTSRSGVYHPSATKVDFSFLQRVIQMQQAPSA